MERSEVLRKLIEETKLSMRAFAEKANIPNTTLHSMLDRGIGNASVDNVIKICKALGITVEQLEEMAEREYIKPTKENIKMNILTKAAHSLGHDGPLSNEDMEKIELAIKIALAKNNN